MLYIKLFYYIFFIKRSLLLIYFYYVSVFQFKSTTRITKIYSENICIKIILKHDIMMRYFNTIYWPFGLNLKRGLGCLILPNISGCDTACARPDSERSSVASASPPPRGSKLSVMPLLSFLSSIVTSERNLRSFKPLFTYNYTKFWTETSITIIQSYLPSVSSSENCCTVVTFCQNFVRDWESNYVGMNVFLRSLWWYRLRRRKQPQILR